MPYVPGHAAPVGDPRRAVAAVQAARVARLPLGTRRRVPLAMLSRAELGAEGELPPAVAAWQGRVRAAGGIPTRMPATRDPLNANKLAARYGGAGTLQPNTVPRYELADAAALAADGKGAAVLNSAIVAGQRVERVEQLVRDVAAAPRNIVGSVLGIPPWAVTAAALGVGALLLKSFLPGLGGSPRHNPPRRQPGGRRRSRRR